MNRRLLVRVAALAAGLCTFFTSSPALAAWGGLWSCLRPYIIVPGLSTW